MENSFKRIPISFRKIMNGISEDVRMKLILAQEIINSSIEKYIRIGEKL